ncbi:MAG: hypothetical protein GY804_09230 [Alphaproteobacteria bacterium]|nr:hypothetical protein [Alphaproteobacteria bacterium]
MSEKNPTKYSRDSGEQPLYSYGTTSIIDTIFERAEDKNFPFDTILIDLSTVYRNIYSDNPRLNYDQIKPMMTAEISMLCKAIQEATIASNIYSVSVTFFLGNYINDFDKDIVKKRLPKQVQVIQDYIEYELPKLNKKRTIVSPNFEVLVTAINRNVNTILHSHIGSMKNYHKVLVMSHMPYLMLLSNIVREFHIIYSHTGKIHSPIDLSKKVFKNELIPFNTPILTALGDNQYLKGRVTNKQKRKIRYYAEEEGWFSHSTPWMKQRIEEIIKETP